MKTLYTILLFFVSITINAQKVTNFRLPNSQNKNTTYLELKGEKLTVIDFWATWCKPCIKAIPELNKVYEKFKDQGVSFISINCDGPRSIAKAVPMSNSLKIAFPLLLDINSEVKNQLNLAAFPSLVIVNAAGKIVFIHEGFADGYEEEISQALEKQLKEI
ncbi:TlpA family protein disulfide reductase [Flavobacterium glaciei]|uniref:Peroxiredoxin n=1 Tax=Flavobacterium glaciei TaxID=386300 RepID=A0A562Q2J6_9FLAO|nr:TlpA disulfide reductase family protein [Flavobacterium glaciei]RDI57644.1 peroxiredoxin [Flavobacterium glaciei]TWI50556.1 peroxiredoxin [Flavobacterium glaciei]